MYDSNRYIWTKYKIINQFFNFSYLQILNPSWTMNRKLDTKK